MSYQKVIFEGNLGRDPEMRYTPSGTPVTNLNVACNRKYTTGDGQQVKETTWYKVSVFGRQAEACAQYLKKGSAVLVEGRLTPDKTTGGPRTFTRNDGSTGASYEVNASEVVFLGGRNDTAGDEPSDDADEGYSSNNDSDL